MAAFESLIPGLLTFGDAANEDGDLGPDAIPEGVTFKRTVVFKVALDPDDPDSPLVPYNLSDYVDTPLVLTMKTAATENEGVTTGCPTGTATITNAVAAEVEIEMTADETNAQAGFGEDHVHSGIGDVVAFHNIEEDSVGVPKSNMLFFINWALLKTARAI